MAGMNERPLARIEARIASVVEGAFSQVFGNPASLQAVLARLTSALDLADIRANPAPARLLISITPDELAALHRALPSAEEVLAGHVAEQRALRGQPSWPPPEVAFQSDTALAPGMVTIRALRDAGRRDPTGSLPRVDLVRPQQPQDAYLMTDRGDIIALSVPIVTLGRATECAVALDDPYVSRLHAQIRLRGDAYVLLDAGSQSGTYVNGSSIHEHRLRSGDVIRIGRTHLIYQDGHADETHATQPMPPKAD